MAEAIAIARELVAKEGGSIDIGSGLAASLQAPIYLGKKEEHTLEVLISESDNLVGFVMLQGKDKSHFLIENPLLTYCREGLEYRTFVGIEVSPKYRRSGLGHALLSLGIGAAIIRTQDKCNSDFLVEARTVGEQYPFWEQFGFEIIRQPTPNGGTHYSARYSLRTVKELHLNLRNA